MAGDPLLATPRRRLRRTTLHDEIVDALRAMIVRAELRPGERIPEVGLCRDLGVSRTPLREALKVLASEGLVELLPNRGALATPVDGREIAQVFETIGALEAAVGRLVCERISEAALAELEDLHAAMLGLYRRGDRAGYVEANQGIHRRLAEETGNPVLATHYEILSRKVQRARNLANLSARRWQESTEEHEAFMAALRARDGAGMSRLLEEHAERTGDAVLAALAALPPANA